MSPWPEATLASVCTRIQDGAHRSPQRLHDEPGPGRYPYLTSKNIRTGGLKLDTLQYCEADFHDEIYRRCNPELGDILLTKDGANTGQAAINSLDEPFSLLSSVCLLKPDRDRLLSGFLHYYLQSDEGFSQITGQMTGAAIKRIILRTIKSSFIPLPSLEEQGRIVAILDEAMAAIDTATRNTKQNLASAEELFEGVLRQAMEDSEEGWDNHQLGDVCRISSSLVDPKGSEFRDLVHVGAGNMVSGSGDLVELQTASQEGLTSGKHTFDDEAVLYSKIRPYLRKVARPDFSGLCSADVYPLSPDGISITRDYLYYLLLSPAFTDYAISVSARAGMPKVNRVQLFGFTAPLPALQRQIEVTELLDTFVADVRQLASTYTKKQLRMDDLRRSLLRKAFSGELTADPKTVDKVLLEAGA